MLLSSLSMVVHDFHRYGPFVSPPEADPPLVVDPNAVLAGAVPEQHLELVAA